MGWREGVENCFSIATSCSTEGRRAQRGGDGTECGGRGRTEQSYLALLNQSPPCVTLEAPCLSLRSSSAMRGGRFGGSIRPLSGLTFAEFQVTSRSSHKYVSRNFPLKRNSSSSHVKPFRPSYLIAHQVGTMNYLAQMKGST